MNAQNQNNEPNVTCKYNTDFQEPTMVELHNELKKAIQLVSGEKDDEDRREGIALLDSILAREDQKVKNHGYDLVIYKELSRIISSENGDLLKDALKVLETHYFDDKAHWDDLVYTLSSRAIRTSEMDACVLCLESISELIDHIDESIAKHAGQLLKLSDINQQEHISNKAPLIVQAKILTKLKGRLNQRICDI